MSRPTSILRAASTRVVPATPLSFEKSPVSITLLSIVVLCSVLALGACSTERRHSPSVTRLANGMCTTETPIGSHRPVQVCRSNAQIEADRKQAQQTLNKVRNTPNSTVPRS